jgi:hypothetical protein
MSDSGNTPSNPYGEQPTAPYGQQPAYGTQPAYGQPGGYPPAQPSDGKGLFGALFDLSFSTFVTPKIIKAVYILGLVAILLGTVFFALSGFFGDSPAVGIVTLVAAPLVGFLYLCLFRMMCEFYLAITRMSEDINRRLPSR